MNTRENQLMVAYVDGQENIHALNWCGQILASGQNAAFQMHTANENHVTLPETQQKLASLQPDLMLMDWPNSENGSAWLRFSLQENLRVVFIRWPEFRKINRVLILSGGGIHVLRQLWIAQRTAEAYGCPSQVLQIIRNDDEKAESAGEAIRLQARMLGINAPFKVAHAQDILSGLAANVEKGDLLVLGAPNHWRLSEFFTSSVPERIARHFDNPLMMLLGSRPAYFRLREVFWPGMINLSLPSLSKEEAIGCLLDCMIRNEQIPANWRERLLQQALAREQISSTAVGSETAFPHITMPIQGGLAGCLGIFPNGVDFDASDAIPCKFIFLFITPDFYYSDYLDLLSHIAGKVADNHVRQQLLECRNSHQVLKVLDP
jgi:mannitol/fructose-specific phosphotransferase system IIA component (Ntr-type)/nucleotide-binding universal stress UspA family protein